MTGPRQLAAALGALAAMLLTFSGCANQPRNVSPAPAPPTAAAPRTTNPIPTPAPESVATPSAPVESTPAPVVQPEHEEKAATVMGSEESSAMLDSLTVYLTSIDGRALSAGREGWNVRMPLKPGRHRLGVAFVRGVFAARADLEIDAAAGKSYAVRFATDAQFLGRNSYCDFWLVETASGEKTAAPIRAALTRLTLSR